MRTFLPTLLLLGAAACAPHVDPGTDAGDDTPVPGCAMGAQPGDLTCAGVIGGPGSDGLSRILPVGDGTSVATFHTDAAPTAPPDLTMPTTPGTALLRLDGDLHPTAALALGADVNGSPIGMVGGDVIIGGTTTEGTTRTGLYLGRWTLAGTAVWERRLPFSDPHANNAIDTYQWLLGDGEIVLAASMWQGAIDLGDGPRSFGVYSDLVVARYGLDGGTVGVRQYGDANQQALQAAAISADGDLVLAGVLGGTLDLGDTQLDGPADYPNGSESQMFFARLAPDGHVRWAKMIGDTSLESVGGVAVTASDAVVALVHEFSVTPDPTVLGDSLVRFDDSGEPTVLAPISPGLRGAMTPLADGGVVVSGSAAQSFTFADQTVANQGDQDGFLVRLGPDLGVAWTLDIGGPGTDVVRAVTVRADGALIVAGAFTGDITAGTAPLGGQGGLDAYSAIVAP